MSLYQITKEIFENREYSPCWFVSDGDCANWETCLPSCPIVQLREKAGIEGTKDGSVPVEKTHQSESEEQ